MMLSLKGQVSEVENQNNQRNQPEIAGMSPFRYVPHRRLGVRMLIGLDSLRTTRTALVVGTAMVAESRFL